ncbi:MAG: TAXI family TRAP transporter solute-binding subunit [Acetobacteraceae bacterium]
MVRKLLLAALLAAASVPVCADEVKLPPTLSVTAYDTGSSGFNIAIAVGKAFKDKYGTDLRVLPAGNDVARLAPVRANRAQFSSMGIGIYYAQEAVFEFAVKEWGPQRLQLLYTSNDCNGAALGVAKDTGVKELKDLKGKRVATVVGSPALNQNVFAALTFGGLTPADVRLVEFSSFGAAWKGFVNNEVDAAWASTITGQAREAETSPRGLVWMPMPHADKDAWARMLKQANFFAPHIATCGAAGMSPQNPLESATYPYPIFTAYATQNTDLVYSITKAMITLYDKYKDAAPGAAGMALDKQLLEWVIPYHPGAVKALTEAGAWTPKHEAHNQALLKRQDVINTAWTAFLKTNPPEASFRKDWMQARKDALVKAGMHVIFE